jgi:uncharacterized membrane protein
MVRVKEKSMRTNLTVSILIYDIFCGFSLALFQDKLQKIQIFDANLAVWLFITMIGSFFLFVGLVSMLPVPVVIVPPYNDK